jgi:hypothetical protein
VLDGKPGARDVKQGHGQAVSDDVVQFTGDTVALLGAGPLGQVGLGGPQLLD